MAPTHKACRTEEFQGAWFTVCQVDSAKNLRLLIPFGTRKSDLDFKKYAPHIDLESMFKKNSSVPLTDHRRVGRDQHTPPSANFRDLARFLDKNDVAFGLHVGAISESQGGDDPKKFAYVLGESGSDKLGLYRADLMPAFRQAPDLNLGIHLLLLHDGIMQAIGAGELSRQSGVGLNKEGEATFVASENKTSLRTLAGFMKSLKLTDAVSFDNGTPALWVPSIDRMDNDHLDGQILVLLTPGASVRTH